MLVLCGCLSKQCLQKVSRPDNAWFVFWIASRLERRLFIVFPNSARRAQLVAYLALRVASFIVPVWWWCLTDVCKRATYPCGGLLRHVVTLDIWSSDSQFRVQVLAPTSVLMPSKKLTHHVSHSPFVRFDGVVANNIARHVRDACERLTLSNNATT